MAWEPEVTTTPWGRLQVVMENTDVTFFRGVPVKITSWSSGDPFGDASAVLVFPQISPFERVGYGELAWIRGHSLVDINLIRPDGSKKTLWEGMVASIEDDVNESGASLTIQCIGALYQLDYYVRAPKNLSEKAQRLYEDAIRDEFYPPSDRVHLRTGACQVVYPEGMEDSGLKTRYSGGWEKTLTGYLQRLLADMQVDAGQRWTLMKNDGRIPVLRIRPEGVPQYNVTAGAPGVSHSLKSDYSQAPNVIYGEGTDESATTWRNSFIEVGDGENFPQGETRTFHHPVGWIERTHPASRQDNPEGIPEDPPPSQYSHHQVRIETIQKYGAGVSLLDARRSAQRQVSRESRPGWVGTITLTTDPEEGSRFEIQAGQRIRLRHFRNFGPPAQEAYDALHDAGIFLQQDSSGILTRGQFATLLVRSFEHVGHVFPTPPPGDAFPDISGHTHAGAINTLANVGIAQGYSSGDFGPDDELTRAHLAGLMVRTAEYHLAEPLETTYDFFYDDDENIHEPNINKAAAASLVFGSDFGVYRPNDPTTRLAGALVLQRLNRFLGGDIAAELEGIVFHVAQVEADPENGRVDLTVDTQARDLLTIAQLIERSKSENTSPAKMLMANRDSGTTDDTKFPWDYFAGSGSIPTKSNAARAGALPVGTPAANPTWFAYVNGANADPYKRWNIVPVVAAGKGSIQRTEIRAYSANGQPLAIPFHVGVYQLYITELSMPQQPFAPDAFKRDSQDALAGFDPSAAVLWGQNGQRAGYWPGLESEGDPVTGILIDEGTWQFQLPEGENVLWVAIYAEVNAYFQGRFYHGVQ